MRTFVVIGGGLLLAACSGGEQQTAAPAEPVATTSTLSAPVSGGSATVKTPSTKGMTAQVSSLTASVSGLNTRVTDMGLVIDLPSDALFDYDKATLTPNAEIQLRKATELIRASPPGSIQVIGHTDSNGDDSYNQTLSEARAKTVADWFGQQVGVRQRAFAVSGKGETAPIAPNTTPNGKDDPAGRTKNRRVEVVVPTSSATPTPP